MWQNKIDLPGGDEKKNCSQFAFSNDSNVEYENSYGIFYLLSGK